MRYLLAVLFSVSALLILIGRTEGRMPWRALMQILPNNENKEWSESEKREHRKKQYKIIWIEWAIFTVGAVVYVIFFVD